MDKSKRDFYLFQHPRDIKEDYTWASSFVVSATEEVALIR